MSSAIRRLVLAEVSLLLQVQWQLGAVAASRRSGFKPWS
jgi:hypothetical protein